MRKGLKAAILLAAETLALALIQSQAMYMDKVPYALTLWMLFPLFSAFLVYRAVRRGLNNYLAWIFPPVCLFSAYLLAWGYSPSAGSALLSAFTGIVAAATGEVKNSWGSSKRKG